MNKAELVQVVAEQLDGVPKVMVERVLNAVVDSIQVAVAGGDRVKLVGFGTFEARDRQGRQGRNPTTKELIEIPARRVPYFVAGAGFRGRL